MIKYIAAIAGFLIALNLRADTYPKNPGIDMLNYAFRIEVSNETDEIKGVATLDVRFVSAGISTLRLDLIKASAALQNKGMTVSSVSQDGKSLSFTHEGDQLLITLPVASTAGQQIRVVVSYSGVPSTGLKIANNKYGDRGFFSDNWPDKGRHWLPMVDHPYDKATCEFIVVAPSEYQVISNGLKIEESDLGNNKRLTHWKQSVPIAPWLYALGIARFAVQYVDQFDHKSIETWVYHQDREAGFRDFAEPTKQVLQYYSDRIGPFAYEKLANVQTNSVSGGMEAASAIFYSERSVVGDRNERWRNVVIHEIAHQWFGNAVTESDWDDVWLSEGFATYFTLLFIDHAYGRKAFLDGLTSSQRTVNEFYKKNPGYTIIHKNLSNMNDVTSSHTYQKGSWTLHMLRGLIGDEAFWKGIRSYYAKYMNRNATTANFIEEMEKASGQELDYFFDQWLYKPGALQLTGSWQYNKKKKQVEIELNQTQNDGSLFTMPITTSIRKADGSEHSRATIQLNGRQVKMSLPMDQEPFEVGLDPDKWVLMDVQFRKK